MKKTISLLSVAAVTMLMAFRPAADITPIAIGTAMPSAEKAIKTLRLLHRKAKWALWLFFRATLARM
jgi:hypothetical protein